VRSLLDLGPLAYNDAFFLSIFCLYAHHLLAYDFQYTYSAAFDMLLLDAVYDHSLIIHLPYSRHYFVGFIGAFLQVCQGVDSRTNPIKWGGDDTSLKCSHWRPHDQPDLTMSIHALGPRQTLGSHDVVRTFGYRSAKPPFGHLEHGSRHLTRPDLKSPCKGIFRSLPLYLS